MSVTVVAALRVVLALGLAGSLFVQTVMVALLARDLDEVPATVRWPVLVIVVLGILTIQVTMLCTWRLLTMVRRGKVFSTNAFRYVDVVIWTVAAAAALLVALGVVLAPGEDVAPGVVLLVGGLGGLVAGVALVVAVLRALLVQATGLRTELDQVV